MGSDRAKRAGTAQKAGNTRKSGTPRYHHGSLRTALLAAAERILRRDGLEGLTLRAAAREAGVSHAAPKNHFDDVRGLLSDLAAIGFRRFRATMLAEIAAQSGKLSRLDAIGLGYIKFAKANPELFTLMFRSERLDFERPALRDAHRTAFGLLAGSVGADDENDTAATLTVAQAARSAAAWSLVHGFACLMLDGRLRPLLAQTDTSLSEMDLMPLIFRPAP